MSNVEEKYFKLEHNSVGPLDVMTGGPAYTNASI